MYFNIHKPIYILYIILRLPKNLEFPPSMIIIQHTLIEYAFTTKQQKQQENMSNYSSSAPPSGWGGVGSTFTSGCSVSVGPVLLPSGMIFPHSLWIGAGSGGE